MGGRRSTAKTPLVLLLVSVGALVAVGVSLSTRGAAPKVAAQDDGLAGALAALEYQPSLQAGVLSAPNRSQALRLWFKEDALRVEARGQRELLVELATVGVGRPATLRSLTPTPAEGVPGTSRVERVWPGLVEWFDNRPEGVEHGWTLSERPAGKGPVTLVVSVAGAQVEVKEQEAWFTPPGRPALAYGKLEARDARGRRLAARMLEDEAGLRIEVTDDDAAYPVTVDPLLSATHWTAWSGQSNGVLACSVASAGDVNGDGFTDFVVGFTEYDNGEENEGRAALFLGSAAGLSPTPAWTAESNQPHAQFGHSVASAGDVNGDGYSDVIVGAILFDNGETDEGRAFLYLGGPAGLSAAPAWTAEANQPNAGFAMSLACAGDVNRDGFSDVVVSTVSRGLPWVSRASLYLGSRTGLSVAPAWTAEEPAGWFGVSVASAGDVNGDRYSDVVVGSINGAFVYLGGVAGLSSSPAWSVRQDGYFGTSVASAGDVNGDGFSDLVVGAQTDGNSKGSAFLFLGGATGLASSPAWSVTANSYGSYLGTNVAGAGDVNADGFSDVVVTCPMCGPEAGSRRGQVLLYLGSASGLVSTPEWVLGTHREIAFFWGYVAGAGDVDGDGFSDVAALAVLAGNEFSGVLHTAVFPGSAAGLSPSPAWTAAANQPAASLGAAASSAGDVNGDGFTDVVVGAPTFDDGEEDEGRALLYLGTQTGLSPRPTWTAESNQRGARFGSSVAAVGDVNGDGFGDVAVGAAAYDNGETDEGRVFLYLGGPSGLSATPAWTSESNQSGAAFGASVAGVGDVNGDGFSDVLVGAAGFDDGQPNEGRAALFLGKATGLSATPAWTAQANQADAAFGATVDSAGDVNGDGFLDVIVGAAAYDDGETDEGRAWVYLGSAAGLSATPAWTAESNQAGARFGSSVATAGDVNGDGFSDVVVGADGYDFRQTDEGRVFVYLGSASGLSPTPAWTAVSKQAHAHLGASASAGDVNGDGFSDVLVGAWAYDEGEADEGRVFVYLGGAAGLASKPAWVAEPNRAGASFGASVASAGDVNGDGFSDVLVGASSLHDRAAEGGRAFLYLGGDGAAGPGRARHLGQRFGGTLVAAGARVLAPLSLEMRATNAAGGLGQVRVETEVKRVGTPFDGRGTSLSPLAAAGSVLSTSTPSLAPGSYHWRARVVAGPFKSRWLSFGGNAESATDFHVLPEPTVVLTPSSPTTSPRGTVRFLAAGGSDTGFTFRLASNRSGASLTTAGAFGTYTAGAVPNVVDVVRATDSVGRFAEVSVTVGPGVSLVPDALTLPPGGRHVFVARGGSGEGYSWSLTSSSGGTVDASTGAYVAGRTGEVSDVVTARDTLGNAASVEVRVTAALRITPARAEVAPGASVVLSVEGGTGAGFTWTLARDESGASLEAVDGQARYVAGARGPSSDVVQVTDALGNVATAAVDVLPAAQPGGGQPSCGCQAGASGWWLLGLGVLRRRRKRRSVSPR